MDNRSRLQAVALDLFAARGYDAVGVQEIVEAAGVTKPTLYHYFGNKQGLLQSALHDPAHDLLDQLAAEAAYHGDLPLNLSRIVRTYFRFARQRPTFLRLLLALWFAPPESEAGQSVSPLFLRQHALIEALFTAAASDHGNMRGRSQAYAVTLLGMMNSYVSLFLHGQAELDDDLAFRAVHQYMHGIYS
jgi:TetR/AcrR family transcriptional regulator